jgi:hypothetical protein
VKGESAPAQFSARLDFEAHAAATAGEYVAERNTLWLKMISLTCTGKREDV